MELHRLGVKLFAVEAEEFPISDCVPVFHSWIQQQVVPGHLLIDVHDYSHVHEGPGILLVAHEGNFSIDLANGQTGLLYYRKAASPDDFETQLAGAIRCALHACSLLERDTTLPSRPRFRTDEATLIFNDRLVVPNSEETLGLLRPAVARVANRIWSGPVAVEPIKLNSKERFSLRLRAPRSEGVAALIARV
jgi:hypothetical protein